VSGGMIVFLLFCGGMCGGGGWGVNKKGNASTKMVINKMDMLSNCT